MNVSGPPCPFDLSVDVIDRMLNFEIADHPIYTGLEMQAFDDDPEYGRGVLAFLTRRDDGRAYVYRQPGLRLDPRAFQVGRGLGGWTETMIAPARLDITDYGVDAALGFRDGAGRTVDVRIDDRGRRPRRPGRLLAPFGAAVEHPHSLLLAYMRRFDLLRIGGREFRILIDGRPVRTGSLPGAWLHRRRLVKYAADIVVVRLNQAQDGPLPTVDPTRAEAVDLEESSSIAAVTARRGEHRARLRLTPPLPDLSRLDPEAAAEGAWHLDVDELNIGGNWFLQRHDERVELIMDVSRGWRPSGLPPLMRIMTSVVRMFRTWPTTYRWTATISLDSRPTMRSRWERTGSRRDATYRRLTRSAVSR
jgi:hypothetical protein